jgi:hypothetical protein
MFIPSIRQAPNGFPQSNRKFRNRLQALDGARRQAVAPRE